MTEILAQASIVIGVLASIFVSPAIAISILQLRKKRARQRRRSPISIELLRGPGHSLRQRLDELQQDMMGDVAGLMAVSPTIALIFLAQAMRRGIENMEHLLPIYVLGGLTILVLSVRKLLKHSGELDNLRVGYDAEVAAGQELDQLMRRGAVVFHDFPADGFNIDHVVISTRGVFAVETKGYTKRNDTRGKAGATVAFDGAALSFPHWTTKEPLEQAERQAKWLERWIASAAGEQTKVLPVVALPGWFVERKGRGPVRVFSGRELSSLLDSVGTSPMTAEAMQRVVHQVEQKCRDVARTYS